MVKEIQEDPFDDDTAVEKFLQLKPSCFIILGKPGSGKSSLAKKFSRYTKSILVSVPEAIQHAIVTETTFGIEARKLLLKGEMVPEELSLKILIERLNSTEVQHYGYILDGFPNITADKDDIELQVDLIKNLTLKPDFIINLRLSDADVINRRCELKADPVTNKLYTKNFYFKEDDDGIIPKPESLEEDIPDPEEEDVDEDEDDDDEDENFEDPEEIFEDPETEAEESKKILKRLIHRNEEFFENLKFSVAHYRQHVLPVIFDYISSHDQQNVIELDANLPEKTVFQNLKVCMDACLLHYGLTPTKLQGEENQEEVTEDTDVEDMLRTLAASSMIAPGFRWKRSKWGRLCPVSLYNGQIVLGNPQFSLSFLDKLFLLANEEAKEKFIRNPRRYITPPQPMLPCKMFVLGAPLSGKSTMCRNLASKYDCKVLNVNELIDSKMCELPTRKAEEEKVKRLAIVIEKVKGEEKGELDDDDEQEVDENHPKVQEMLANEEKTSEETIIKKTAELTPEDYVDCLEQAFLKLYEGTEKGPSSGGWILDGFPTSKEQFNTLVERGIVPDDVIVFREESNTNENLISRWKEKQRKDFPEQSEEEEASALADYERSLTDFDRNWTSMQSTMRNTSNLEPILVFSKFSEQEAFDMVIKKIEEQFQYQGWEYTGMDQDEEEEDYAAGEEIEEDEDIDPNKKKPYGETAHFCPIMLHNKNVLWPGSPDYAVKYREKVYFLSSPEARDQFLETPEMYLPKNDPLEIPPVRLLLLGPKGSGKTLHGRLLAKKFGVLHISFKDLLQELILHKTQKKIGPDFEIDDENAEDEAHDDGDEELEKHEEKPLELNDFEENIRNNILEGEPLEGEVLDLIVSRWWHEEPFKSTGFILEGFPRTTEEAKHLAANGLFPDGALILTVEEKDICDRLLPPIHERWKVQRDRRETKREKQRLEKLKFREEERIRRKREKLQEIESRKLERMAKFDGDRSDDGVEAEDDDIVDIDEIIDLELLEELGEVEDEEEEEETEEEAVDRMKIELTEKFEDEMSVLETVQETLEEILIPRIEIDASRKVHITQYILNKMLRPQVELRSSLFDRCQIVSMSLARKLLNAGYKQPSRFGRWDPVKLYDHDCFPPFNSKENPPLPVVYRQHIYFISSEENRERFMQSPQTFLKQPSPKPLVPIKIAVIGPPKSGKTTLANRFAKEHGLMRLSVGEAIRKVMTSHIHTELAREIQNQLMKGLSLPDELAIQALNLCLLDPVCRTKGFVIDGYPTTVNQMELLQEQGIIPYKVVQLNVSDRVLMQRGLKDRKSAARTFPIHDSHTILAIKIAGHRRENKPISVFYRDQYKNLLSIDGEKSKWWVYNETHEEVQKCVSNIQTYIERSKEGNAAGIKYMCITPREFQAGLGEFGEYCPVTLADHDELVDCSADTSHTLVAEYRGKYYKFPSIDNMEKFLTTPSKYVLPLAPRRLPDYLPKKRCAAYVKKSFPSQIELQGYCPVTFYEGAQRYESIIPGETNLIVEYRKKLYSFASEDCLEKFMRSPKTYSNLNLPNKVPPKRDPVIVSGLPMIGYMEQTVSTAIIKALTAVGCLKPKYPYLSARKSALLYVAYHLKANNPKANDYVRKKYKQKLKEFEQRCELITYLSNFMKWKYMEPEDRPIDFDNKLASFNSLHALCS